MTQTCFGKFHPNPTFCWKVSPQKLWQHLKPIVKKNIWQVASITQSKESFDVALKRYSSPYLKKKKSQNDNVHYFEGKLFYNKNQEKIMNICKKVLKAL